MGAAVATGAIFTGLALEGGHPTVNALLTQPAVISVPVAFAVMVAVSLRDRTGPREATRQLLALHAPEGLGLGLEPDEEGCPPGLASALGCNSGGVGGAPPGPAALGPDG